MTSFSNTMDVLGLEAQVSELEDRYFEHTMHTPNAVFLGRKEINFLLQQARIIMKRQGYDTETAETLLYYRGMVVIPVDKLSHVDVGYSVRTDLARMATTRE